MKGGRFGGREKEQNIRYTEILPKVSSCIPNTWTGRNERTRGALVMKFHIHENPVWPLEISVRDSQLTSVDVQQSTSAVSTLIGRQTHPESFWQRKHELAEGTFLNFQLTFQLWPSKPQCQWENLMRNSKEDSQPFCVSEFRQFDPPAPTTPIAGYVVILQFFPPASCCMI